MARDMAFSVVPWLVMRAQHNVGMPGWRYWFDYVSENARDLYPHGTWHGNEVPYVMNTLTHMPEGNDNRPYTAKDRAFSDRVSDYWFTFARDASEFTHTLKGELAWPAWRAGEDVTLSLGDQQEDRLVLRHNFMKARLRLFRLMMAKMVRL